MGGGSDDDSACVQFEAKWSTLYPVERWSRRRKPNSNISKGRTQDDEGVDECLNLHCSTFFNIIS